MDPRTIILLTSLSCLLYSTTAATCVRSSVHTRRRPMYPAILRPPSCHVDVKLQAICNRTDNPELCISSVRPYLPNDGDVNPEDVLLMEIMACASYTNVTLTVATRMAKDPKTPEATVSCLRVCQDSYRDALDNLQSAVEAIGEKDGGTLNSMLSAALTDFETCEDTFTEEPGGRSPMSNYDDRLSKMASNCLAIAELLK